MRQRKKRLIGWNESLAIYIPVCLFVSYIFFYSPDSRLSSVFICPPGLYIFRDKGNLIPESRAQMLTCLEASFTIMDDPRLVPSFESNHDNTLCKLMHHRTTLIIYFTQKTAWYKNQWWISFVGPYNYMIFNRYKTMASWCIPDF